MNKNDDATDQMLLLLALIKEQREAIGDDREKLDRFYAEVQGSILEKAEKSFIQTNQQATHALKSRISELDKSIKGLDNRYILLYSSMFIGLILSLLLALFLLVPSLDEIQQRRSEIAKLKEYSLDLSKCDGKTCVKVMTKQCGYGKNGDYCVIDKK